MDKLTDEARHRIYEDILNYAHGDTFLELADVQWFSNPTLCLSSTPVRSQVDSDGVYREYIKLVRFICDDNYTVKVINVCECGINKLDKWPDNSTHPECEFHHRELVIELIQKTGLKVDLIKTDSQ
jgi:hypothetical protein